ncbi:hypothetical protein ALC57_10812 [Trachymyrmex cornetzi]|uniref:Uncharacterized protein n=1 Tax=Trachymyrmex cornetzi TaxID=471704 RepID=A0A151J3H1_9HYME|nr:hypothetical protein ALC57_10812 [Trachymyrmex cornetzi]
MDLRETQTGVAPLDNAVNTKGTGSGTIPQSRRQGEAFEKDEKANQKKHERKKKDTARREREESFHNTLTGSPTAFGGSRVAM